MLGSRRHLRWPRRSSKRLLSRRCEGARRGDNLGRRIWCCERERQCARLHGGAYGTIGELRERLGSEGDSLCELLPDSGILLLKAATYR